MLNKPLFYFNKKGYVGYSWYQKMLTC